MNFSLSVVSAPAAEPVSLTETKLHLRVTGDGEDLLISTLITAARQSVEETCSRALITQTLDYTVDGWPCGGFVIPRPPLVSVSSIKYRDTAGAEATWGSTNYIVRAGEIPGRVVPAYGVTYPTTTLQPAGGVTVRYVAGYGDADDVPAALKAAMLLMIGDLYEHREGIVVGQTATILAENPTVSRLLAPYRAWW